MLFLIPLFYAIIMKSVPSVTLNKDVAKMSPNPEPNTKLQLFNKTRDSFSLVEL